MLFETGDREKQFAGYVSILKLVDIDFAVFSALEGRSRFELHNIADIAFRLCDLCVFNAVCGFELPSELGDCAELLYKKIAIEQPWEKFTDGSKEAVEIGLAIRRLLSAVTYLKGYKFPCDEYFSLDSPFFELDLAFIDFVSSSTNDIFVAAGKRFLQAVRVWRSMISSLKVRNALRNRISFFTNPFLRRLRQESTQDWHLLSEAEELLGPSRWLEEQLADNATADEKVPVVLRPEAGPPKDLFREKGAIVQILPVDDDLIVIGRDIDYGSECMRAAQGRKISSGARRLRHVYEQYFSDKGIVNNICSRLLHLSKENIHEFNYLRQELHHAAIRAASEVGSVVLPFIDKDALDGDVLLVSPDPRILCLPWSLAHIDDLPLIKHTRSLSISASIGASNRLCEIAKSRSFSKSLDVAAYCDCSQGLNWRRLFRDRNGNACGLGALEVASKIGLRTYGIGDSDCVSVEDVMNYPAQEADLLLVCGHGDPSRGVRLGMDHWNPLNAASSWRLKRTQCAIVPSCRLGQLLWDTKPERLSGDIDPGRHEISGFMAHLCLSHIPRIIACPWVAFDISVSRLISRIVERAISLQSQDSPHIWARALRDVVVDDLASTDENRPYDLANLVLFGSP